MISLVVLYLLINPHQIREATALAQIGVMFILIGFSVPDDYVTFPVAGSPHLILTKTKPNCEYKWAKRISVKKKLERIVTQFAHRNR